MNESWQRKILLAIPSVNGAHLLARMLPTLRFDPAQVVVLDQDSVDGTAAVCAAAGVEVLQLGRPHTYTEACNIGARLARERGCDYVCVSNNDIVFRTDVMRETWEAMEQDPSLGIVAPSQVIVDESRCETTLSPRVFWRLDAVAFGHDTNPVPAATRRLDADFCELTCALVRLSVVARIGFLDDAFGFYHEDADFGFRLRLAGYGCAYLPASQIQHFTSSTFNQEPSARRLDFQRRNRVLFARKHLGYGLNLQEEEDGSGLSDPNVAGAALGPLLRRFGLLAEDGPPLRSFPHFGDGAAYRWTTLDGPAASARHVAALSGARAVFAASGAMRDLLAAAGVAPVHHLPLGVEPDVFNPWVPATRLGEGPMVLAMLEAAELRSLRAVLAAWHRHVAAGRPGLLVLVGRGLRAATGLRPDVVFALGEVEVSRHPAERIEIHEPTMPLAPAARAALLRGADAVLHAAAGEGAPMPALEAMACGVPAILGDYGLSGEIAADGTLTYGRDATAPSAASYWTPSVEGIATCLDRVVRLDGPERAAIVEAGLRKVRGHHSLRHSAMALYRALPGLQTRDPSRHLREMEREDRLGTAAAPSTLQDAPTAGVRAARRVRVVGHLASQFGSVWEEEGLRRAGGATFRRVLSFARRRLDRPVFRRPLERLRDGARDLAASVRGAPGPLSRSTLLVGYSDGQLGLGQSLRGLALALAEAGLPFRIRPIGLGVEGRRVVPFMPERTDETEAHAVNVIEVTAVELPRVIQHIGPRFFERGHNILRTYWELSRAPEAWRPNLAGVSEIWAPNTFVAESFRSIFDGPITVVPPCVVLPDEVPEDRAALGMEEGVTTFLFSFDYFSFPARKNPIGVVRAFREAFPDPGMPARLIVKATGAPGGHAAIRRELSLATAYDERITILDETVSQRRMFSLIAAADCYVSLHRAEGFGYGMAEAMALGKPVIGTAYSGNAEFVTEETAYPIPYMLRPLTPDEYVYPEGQVWAEPDVAAAAVAMRRVVAVPAEAAARAEAGRRLILSRYGRENVGRMAAARLREILAATP